MKIRKLFVSALVLAVALIMSSSIASAQTYVPVTPSTMNGWFFYNDENDTIDPSLGTFVVGPGNPVGVGSAQISVSGTQRRNLATYQFSGTPLAAITTMKFATFNPSAGNGGSPSRSAYLNFNVDFNGTDTWQKRLVFLPSDNGVVLQNTWQEWDTIRNGAALWRYSGATWPITGEPGSTPKTWNQILAQYSGVRIRVSDSWLGMRVGEPYPNGYTENIDTFSFGVNGNLVVFDFEPYVVATNKDACKGNGWMGLKRANGSSFKNQGDCIQYVNTGK